MQTHLPVCYRGPVSRARGWWPSTAKDTMNEQPMTVGDDVPSLGDPDIRADLVRRVRREIAAGTYDTPEKWEAALDRFLNRLEEK